MVGAEPGRRGVGAKTAPRLERLGLSTVGDVCRLSLQELRRHLGARAGAQFHPQARDIADDQFFDCVDVIAGQVRAGADLRTASPRAVSIFAIGIRGG